METESHALVVLRRCRGVWQACYWQVASCRNSGRGLTLRKLLLALAALTAVVIFPSIIAGAGDPWIQSDKLDYAPGELVTLTGGNWAPGETVRIVTDDDQGNTWKRDVTVVADGDGDIVDVFNLPTWFVATYRVVASGTSGIATTSFTDANVTVGQQRFPATGLAVVTAGSVATSVRRSPEVVHRRTRIR